jgi:hypothetical protein
LLSPRGDYDGDNRADLAIFRESTGQWFVFGTSSGFLPPVQIGVSGLGDLPLPADYDEDGKADLAVFRGSTGRVVHLRLGHGSAGSGPLRGAGPA